MTCSDKRCKDKSEYECPVCHFGWCEVHALLGKCTNCRVPDLVKIGGINNNL